MKQVAVANQEDDKNRESEQDQAAGLLAKSRARGRFAGLVLGFCFHLANSKLPSFSRSMLHWRSIRMPSTPMSAPHASAGRIARFGIYEANLSVGELRKNGARIRLQEQPFQVLAVLLERPGEVVTREDLRTRLWNAETFVDFDHSLNTAINKLRDALGDSAANPRFVETLAKRGYRFIAPVRFEEARNADRGALQIPSAGPGDDLPRVNRAWPRSLFALIQIMYLVFYVLALIRFEAVGVAADKNLAPLRSETVTRIVLITAAVGIALRLYLVSGVAFDHRRLGEKFRRIFPPVLLLDLLWALAPFLILDRIGIGGAVAAMAALLYVPFAERTLLQMAYPDASAG